jgi:oxygen-independent coproporphyrinogen-3 oxidase
VRRREAIADYLSALKSEISAKAPFLKHLFFGEIQFGGGSPSSLTPAELSDLFFHIKKNLQLSPDCEIGIELHPNHLTDEHFRIFADCGFNRFSIGVQDFNPKVQQAIGRVHGVEKVAAVVEKLRQLPGLRGINFDLVYGFPYQNVESFTETMQQVLRLQPDRAAVFNYAHIPKLKPLQKKIATESLPSVKTKTAIFCNTIEQFRQAGYLFIGLDHFARPTDKLAQALQNGQIYRNFMGYTASGRPELLGIGNTAISEINGSFFQNARKLVHYYRTCRESAFPVEKGHISTADDFLRREIILSLMCRQKLVFAEIEKQFNIDFCGVFAEALSGLKQEPAADGLLEMTDDFLQITEKGRFFIRNICAFFDGYLDKSKQKAFFSKSL